MASTSFNSLLVESEGNTDISLIQLVEQFPLLYDKKNKDYKNAVAKQNAWIVIGEKLNISANACEVRWNQLRNRFSKERRKVFPSGSGGNESKQWHLLYNLQFLEKCIKTRNSFGNIGTSLHLTQSTQDNETGINNDYDNDDDYDIHDSTIEVIEYNDESSSTLKTPPFNKRKLTQSGSSVEQHTPAKVKKMTDSTSDAENEAFQAVKNLCESITSKSQPTEYEQSMKSFFDSLIYDCKKLSPYNFRKFKKDIIDVLEKYISMEEAEQ